MHGLNEGILGCLLVVGSSHLSSTEVTRKRLFIDANEIPSFLEKLVTIGFDEVVALSTCARTEIFGLTNDLVGVKDRVIKLFEDIGNFGSGDLISQLHHSNGEDALRHLFCVAGSLESPIIGEPEIIGQFRHAVNFSEELGFARTRLLAVLRAVNRTSKRIRSETHVGRRPVSLAACASQVAREINGDLKQARALMLASGEMGEIIIEHLHHAGLSSAIILANKRVVAKTIADRFGFQHDLLSKTKEYLPHVEIVVSALGSENYFLNIEDAENALILRRRRPMLFLDTAIPSDINPQINELEGAFVYSLDDLEKIAFEGRSTRSRAAGEAKNIVEEEIATFKSTLIRMEVVPTIIALRDHFERVRSELLVTDYKGDPLVDQATRLLVNRLLHAPSEELASLIEKDNLSSLEAQNLLLQLFRVSFPKDPRGENN